MKLKTKRWINLLFGTIIMLVLGLIYAWSVFAKPIKANSQWNETQISFTFTLSIIFFVLGLIATGFLTKKIPQRIMMIIAGALFFVGFTMCSKAESLMSLYIGYGVLAGFAVGVANNALVSSVVSWFPDKRGLASGILMMGFGFGGYVLSGIAEKLIDTVGWQGTFGRFSGILAIIIALGVLFTGLPTKEYLTSFDVTGNKARSQHNYSLGEVMKMPSSWLYLLWFTLIMAGGLLIIGEASPFTQSLGGTAKFAANAVGVLSIANGCGRLLTGITADKFGLKVSMRMMTLYLVIASIFLLVALQLGSIPLMLVGFVFVGLSYGGGPTTCSVYANVHYGTEHFASNYAWLSAGMIPSALLGPALVGSIKIQTGGYLVAFIIMLVLAVVAMLVSAGVFKAETLIKAKD